MKPRSILLMCLLAGTALSRPNQEPIFYRSNNPLEVTEELIPTTNALPLVASGGDSDHQTSTGASSGTKNNSEAQATSTTTSTPLAQDHISSPVFKRPENAPKTKIGTSGYVVSTSTRILTSAGLHQPSKANTGEAKANDQIVTFDNFASHSGVAEPMSEEEFHEFSKANDRIRIRVQPTTTTPKEGLSTWVLLSESNSPTSTESKKEIFTTTRPHTTATTRRTVTTSARKPLTTARRRTTTINTRTTTVSEEKKDKNNKFMTRIKVTDGPKPKLEDKLDTITKKTKKPFTPTSAKTTTTTTTLAPTTTTTELSVTESPLGPTASDEQNSDDNTVETSTFLILEPKDALFDLPEDRSPSKVAKKKVTRKPAAAANKKKPATKKKKPEVKDAALKPSEKKPPAKSKPMTTQIMNYLSREVMPTVGVGLVGLMITAGLASYFLGSPLTAALRRSDETNRKDDVYYSNIEDYATSDGQNEEEVFGKLIAGMPERSYYRNTLRRRVSQPVRTGHQYGNYHVQSYSVNKYPQINYRNQPRPAYAGTPEMYTNYNRQVQAKSHNEFYYNTPPSFYTKSSSPVYVAPESTTFSPSTTSSTNVPLTSAEPVSEEISQDISEQDHELLPNPAAYTAEHSPEHHAQYVVGSVYHQDNSMIDIITSAPVPEHGPRRRKRDITSAENEIDNEIDNEIIGSDDRKPEEKITSTSATTTTATETMDMFVPTTEGETGETNPVPSGERPISWSELIRNTVEMKLVVGINLLQHVTSQFQRYLHGVQHRVEEHFNQTSSVVQH
ncbi:mucin-2-like [Armigeres subalbatus]|uniref:mucin-2-like n=1 Tax=Armigeres subalbatus TaxID=124917 RepID=UPI002ED4622C